MTRTVLRSIAILGLWSCLSTQALIAAADTAQAPDINSTGTRLDIDINDLHQHWLHSSGEVLRPCH